MLHLTWLERCSKSRHEVLLPCVYKYIFTTNHCSFSCSSTNPVNIQFWNPGTFVGLGPLFSHVLIYIFFLYSLISSCYSEHLFFLWQLLAKISLAISVDTSSCVCALNFKVLLVCDSISTNRYMNFSHEGSVKLCFHMFPLQKFASIFILKRIWGNYWWLSCLKSCPKFGR